MTNILGLAGISLAELERNIMEMVQQVFREEMAAILERLDGLYHSAVDSERFVVKERRLRTVTTCLGPVEFRRRYYQDREQGGYVALLDQVLGLQPRQRVSEATREQAVIAAVEGPSYRAAERQMERGAGQAILSHEGIRQHLLRTGRVLSELRERAADAADKPKPRVLIVEADGMWPGRQRGKRQEVRLAVSYTGWGRLSPGGKKHQLQGRRDFVYSGRGDFWEEVLGQLEQLYDLSQTQVIINGDRAKWIRAGVEWFPQAMYQIDRFHLVRDLRRYLKHTPALYKEASQALEAGNPAGVLAALRSAIATIAEPERRKQAMALWRDLQSMPEAMVDYRKRLAAKGISSEGLRGIGVAEGAVALYSARLRRVGRSWSAEGLQAMLLALIAHFERRLRGVLDTVERRFGMAPLERGRRKVQERIHAATPEWLGRSRPGKFPAMHRGRSATGGLSRFLRTVSDGGILATV